MTQPPNDLSAYWMPFTANRQFKAGGMTSANQEIVIKTGAFLQNAQQVGSVVVGVFAGRPVYLREVAEVIDGDAARLFLACGVDLAVRERVRTALIAFARPAQ